MNQDKQTKPIDYESYKFFEELLVAFEKDREFEVEYSVIHLQESICKIHKNQGLRIRILLCIIGWCSDMALKINPRK